MAYTDEWGSHMNETPVGYGSGTPTLRLLDALRAGMPLEGAAEAANIPLAVASSVAGSPLAQALLRKAP